MAHIDRIAARLRDTNETVVALQDRINELEALIKHAKGVAFDGERPAFPSVEWICKNPPEEATDQDTWVDL